MVKIEFITGMDSFFSLVSEIFSSISSSLAILSLLQNWPKTDDSNTVKFGSVSL